MSDAPANWYPDPYGRHELRYWDGATWTEHVSDRGTTSIDRPKPSRLDRIDSALTVGNEADQDKIRRQLTDVGHRGAGLTEPVPGGDGTLFNEPVLVVNQKIKVLELNNQYSVFNQHGQQIAVVNQVGQTTAKKVMRLVSSLDQFMTHRLEITDTNGAVVLRLTRPAKFIKSRILVSDGNDQEIGAIVQETMIGKIQFGLQAGDQRLGTIKAENWRAWNFRIEDASGMEVARITKTWEGMAKTMFTTADNYVVQIHRKPEPTLHALVVASALSVDTALKQDARGFG
jgi:uncharacterized protein YxjI